MSDEWIHSGFENFGLSEKDRKFIELITSNGYTLKALRFYPDKTQFLVKKIKIELSWSLWHYNKTDPELSFKCFEMVFKGLNRKTKLRIPK